MGEANRKKNRVRTEFLTRLEEWSFPITDWELQTVEELKELPVIKVPRVDSNQLAEMRMKPHQCHANVRFLAEHDPKCKTEMITGWWLQGENYVLHSIVNQWGDLACVTPVLINSESPFDFIPDSKIEWCEQGEKYTAYRDGVRIGKGIRSSPTQALADLMVIKQRLLSGMNPYEAVRQQR